MSTLLDLDDRDADDLSAPDGDHLLAVRAWARSRGYPIDETSCVPQDVLQTYRRLHAG